MLLLHGIEIGTATAMKLCSAFQALGEDGKGRVLVVDGGASMRCALLGDNLAEMGYKNGWSVSVLSPTWQA